MNDEEYDRLRRPYIEAIEALQREYQKAMKPYIDGLARIETLRGPRALVLSQKQADALAIIRAADQPSQSEP